MRRLAFLGILGVALGCASTPPADPAPVAPAAAPEPAAPADGPPPGIGRTDDGLVHGPYGNGPLAISAYKSTEAGGTVNSWLLQGEHDAALIDTQLINSEAAQVVKMIQASGKTLRWIWITHAHPDHHTGLGIVAAAFPDAQVLAHPRTAEAAPRLFAKYRAPLERFFPGDIPPAAAQATPYEGDTLTLEGVQVKVLALEEGEHEFTTALHVPSMRALFCADLVYNRVHPWLNEMDVPGVLAHVEHLATLDVDTFFPGHGEPFGKDYLPTYRGYVEFFVTQVPQAQDTADLVARVWREHRDWRTMAGLRFSATAHIEARDGTTVSP